MRSIIFFTFFFLAVLSANSQKKYTVSGSLKDAENGEDLIGATITLKSKPGVGAVTNVYGFYSLTLPEGNYTLVYSYIGYASVEEKIELTQDLQKNIELGFEAETLKAVEITAEREDENVTSAEMSVTKINPKDIESIPVLMGERDVMKTVQLLPGVKPAGEGNAGFYVRGGSADQNLILLDEAPVYNASHLLGFFSVFNSDALKDVKLYKGSMPAEYGGRLSSVMDIKMREGNMKRYAFGGSLGLIAAKARVEGPIVKDKGSFFVSGRRTYADLFLGFSRDSAQQNTQLYFYDINAKVNYKLGKKDRLFLSGYFGRDIFSFGEAFGFDWGNATGTLRWNHIFNDKLFSNTSVIYSDYNYSITFGRGDSIDIKLGSTIRDINIKEDLQYYLNSQNTMKFGFNVIHHTFKPGEIVTTTDTAITTGIESRYALESAAYISNEQKIGARLKLNYGFRFSNFTQFGPGDIYTFDSLGTLTDTTTYDDFETVTTYFGFSPRLSGSFILNEFQSLKFGYARNNQYLHLLSNSTSSNPTDIWIPSSNNVKPQISDQWALGYFRNFNKNMFELSTEVYYKMMQNVIDYRIGAQVTLNPLMEGELIYGEGRAYGLELMFRKKKGKLKGWITYTLSRSERRFADVDYSKWFPARQDRTHDVSIVLMWDVIKRLSISATWVYYTGDAVTFPSGKYEINGQVIPYYTERNGYRMPDYHRLDLGVTWKSKDYKTKTNPETGKQEQIKKKYLWDLNLSVYNVYARENAYSISFREDPNDPSKTQAVQLSLFSIVPSISFNFKFN